MTFPGSGFTGRMKKRDAFDIYFCKTKYNAYKILMGLQKEEVETRIAQKSKNDLEFMQNTSGSLYLAEQTN